MAKRKGHKRRWAFRQIDHKRSAVVDGLVAIDGAHGPDVTKAATTLAHALSARQAASGVSRWDASGLFGDVAAAPVSDRELSPRTLILLYAADLAFRLRWEIRPALERGLIVFVAALCDDGDRLWAGHRAVIRLAADAFSVCPGARAAPPCCASAGPERIWKRRPDRGFGECCTTLLEGIAGGIRRRRMRARDV